MDARRLAEAIRDRVAAEADDVEICVEVTDRVSYTIENDLIIPTLEADLFRVSMRALRNGALATAATTVADAGEASGALVRALGAASPGPLASFARPARVDDDVRAYDAGVAALLDRPGDVRKLTEELVAQTRGARAKVALEVMEGALSVAKKERVLLTAHGGPVVSRATSFSAWMMVNGSDSDMVASTTRPSDEVVTGVGRRLLERLPAREVTRDEWLGTQKDITAVLDPVVLETLLRSLLIERVGHDRVRSGLSPWRVGAKVAHEGFTLRDDTGAAGSLMGRATDDEGEEGRAKTVIENGVLRTLLCDRRTSLEVGGDTRSTGNGFRIPILAEHPSEAPVRVGMGHLELAAGEVSREALAAGKSVMIPDLLGVHSANKATGAFNNPIMGGLGLEDGVPAVRLKAGAWSATGNLYTFLRELAGISRERHHTGSALLPWVAGNVRVG